MYRMLLFLCFSACQSQPVPHGSAPASDTEVEPQSPERSLSDPELSTEEAWVTDAATSFETTDTGVDSEREEPPAFAPATGVWTVTASTLTQDGCGLSDMVDRGAPGTTLELMGQSDAFAMTFEAGETVRCSVDDAQGFACLTTETIDPTARNLGLDADILVDITTSGWFEDETTMSMESVVGIDCDGPDCFWVQLLMGSGFPCTMAMASDVVAD